MSTSHARQFEPVVMTWLSRIAVDTCKQHMIKPRRENTVPLDQALH